MTDKEPRRFRLRLWGAALLAFSLPGAFVGLWVQSSILLALGVISFFLGLWCFAVDRVGRSD